MFEKLKALYLEGKINQDGLARAVTKGWITQEQMNQIVGP